MCQALSQVSTCAHVLYSIIPSFILCRTTFIFDFLASLPTDLLVFLLWPLGLGKSIHVYL